jgi:hypothetical protein
VTFRDVNEKQEVWRRIPIEGGRGLLIVDGIKKVAITYYCMAVCCKYFAMWLMRYREQKRLEGTVNCAFTLWKGKNCRLAKLLEHLRHSIRHENDGTGEGRQNVETTKYIQGRKKAYATGV